MNKVLYFTREHVTLILSRQHTNGEYVGSNYKPQARFEHVVRHGLRGRWAVTPASVSCDLGAMPRVHQLTLCNLQALYGASWAFTPLEDEVVEAWRAEDMFVEPQSQ